MKEWGGRRVGQGWLEVKTKENLKCQSLPTILLDGCFGLPEYWKVQSESGNL